MEQFVRRALARAEEVGNRPAQALCYHALGAVLYLVGRWPEAAEAYQRSIALAGAVESVFGEVLGLQRLGLLETGQGRHEVAFERLERALAQARQSRSPMVRGHGIGRILATLAHNRYEAGDLGRATEYLAQGFAMQRRVGDCPSCDVLLYPAAVPIYIALGDLEQAEIACRKAEHAAAAFRSQTWTASARYQRGLLVTARAEWQRAAGSLEGALELFEGLGQVYDIARGMEALAETAERAGAALGHRQPDVLRQRAADLYAQLGAESDAQRLKDYQMA